MSVLELEKVYLRRGDFVLHDISFIINEGETVAILGRSGAGKSTLIQIIGNALLADVGRIRYFGKELYENEMEIRKKISVIYDAPNFNMEMKAVKLAAEIRKFEPWFSMEDFSCRMKEAGLDETNRIKMYSKGMQKKYMLILALCRQPNFLVMDELTSGVDDLSREEMLHMIADYRKKNSLTILFSTHNQEDVKRVATRVLKLENGGLQ